MKAANTGDFRERLAAQGTAVVASSPQELSNYVTREIKRWTAVARDSNIRID